MKKENKRMPELKDIVDSIHRYNAIHKEGVFIFSIVGFKKDLNNKGEEDVDYDESKSTQGAHGHIADLRFLLNELRDIIEDYADEEGWVNY